jgi:hypothetical protein
VLQRIEEGVNFPCNFNILLLVSSLLAALGLLSDNGKTIIARWVKVVMTTARHAEEDLSSPSIVCLWVPSWAQ